MKAGASWFPHNDIHAPVPLAKHKRPAGHLVVGQV